MNAPSSQPTHRAAETCPLCGGSVWQALFSSRDFTIGRCDRCHLVRTLGVEADGTVHYPAFDQRETAAVKLMRTAVGQLLRERARLVAQVAPHGRLLDVGCGSGAFARLMSKRGYDAVGVEPFSLGRPIKEPGLELIRAPFESVRGHLGEFDVITMWHVLEHVPDPKALLELLLGTLRPGGVLVVSVPNFESWQSRVFKGSWFHLDPPRHITHFDHPTLRALFASLGLEIFEERTFHFEYGPVGWLQSALNRILPRPNFLYEFVKDRGALANVPVRQTALNLLASGIAGAALAGPAVVVEALAGVVDAGAVITVAARRAE